jgi:hypothetical protein
MRRVSLSGLRNLNLKPAVPVIAAGRHDPCEIKQLSWFNRVGHRTPGDSRKRNSSRAGYEKVHVVVYVSTHLAYVEVLAEKNRPTTVSFLSRAVIWFNRQGIDCRRALINNGSAYKSHNWRKAAEAMGLKPNKSRPYTPRTNGRPVRFIITLLERWEYVMPYNYLSCTNELLLAYLADL